jgi:hypothetical protein
MTLHVGKNVKRVEDDGILCAGLFGTALIFSVLADFRRRNMNLFCSALVCFCALFPAAGQQAERARVPDRLFGHRFLTFNTEICVNHIETTRTDNAGVGVRRGELKDEKYYRAITPARVREFRDALENGFPGARMTWGISWKALHDTTPDFVEIRRMIVGYHYQYGDDVTLMPHSYFANVYNDVEQLNRDFHDGLAGISRMVGGGFRPKSVIAGFLAAPNLEYLAKEEGIHVCQGNIWSQYSIDNQDGEGSVCYPYYPSREHFCKPAQGAHDFIDCVNLDGWTVDFLAARYEGGMRNGKSYNCRMGVGPIETLLFLGREKGLRQMLHTTALHFDEPNFPANGFAWVTSNWELFLPIEVSGLTEWLAEIRRRWPDTRVITQGEFGLLWREQFRENSFDYRFVEKRGSGISDSDSTRQIRWFMNKSFRLALLSDAGKNTPEEVIDFTRYDLPASEPKEFTRSWSLLGDINQKQTRPQDKPVRLKELPAKFLRIIRRRYPLQEL